MDFLIETYCKSNRDKEILRTVHARGLNEEPKRCWHVPRGVSHDNFYYISGYGKYDIYTQKRKEARGVLFHYDIAYIHDTKEDRQISKKNFIKFLREGFRIKSAKK